MMMMMMMTVLALMPMHTHAHGHLFEPKSRQRLAQESGLDYCPHCTLAAPMKARDESGNELTRAFPGSQAFSEPGTAPSVTFERPEDNKLFGVCGVQKLGLNDYNVKNPGVWGDVITAQWKQGETVDVSWCVNADHGGVYAYRLCDDDDIIKKLQSDTPLTADEQLLAEACFQDGQLRCDDVEGQYCGVEPRCQPEWGCHDAGNLFHCEGSSGYQGKSYACANSDESCGVGVLVKRQIKIPENFPVGRTVLSWRWDSDETVEVFAACADIEILPGEKTPTASPTTPPPAVTPVPTDPAPTPMPTDEGSGVCCWWSPSDDMCSDCQSPSPIGDYCAESAERCGGCGGTWCANGGGVDPATPAPTPRPTPTPAPTPWDACTENAVDFSAITHSDFTTWGYNEDDMVDADGCEVDLAGHTWVAFELEESHEVEDDSKLSFCFEQRMTCRIHAISVTTDPSNLKSGPIFAVAGTMLAWTRPIWDYSYNTPGGIQCFEVPLDVHFNLGDVLTHVAFVNSCNDDLDEYVAHWSTVQVSAPASGSTPAPTAKYGYTGDEPHCCANGSCGNCYAPVFSPFWCGRSASNCESGCGGQFCD